MLSFGTFASCALASARRSRGFMVASPPPSLAATVTSLMTLVKTLPRFASERSFLWRMLAHLECPAMDVALSGSRDAIILSRPQPVPASDGVPNSRSPAMPEPLLVAKAGSKDLTLLPGLANRHGLITGATGTGKTVTLQVLAERFSGIGVPVFMADVKSDLSGIAAAGATSP